MKKLFALFLTVAMMATMLCACGESNPGTDSGSTSNANTNTDTDTNDEPLEIAFAHYQQCEFVSLLQDGIESALEGQNVKLSVLDANYDSAAQLGQVENLISQGVDGIILAPCDQNALVPAIEMCKSADMPLVVVNSRLFTEEDYYLVAPNDIQAGEVEAQAMMDAIGGKGGVIILECSLGASWQIERKQGILNVVETYPDVEVLAIDCANGVRDQAMAKMENFITTYGDKISGVICENDDMAMGVMSVVQSAGLQDSVKIVGVDAIADALNAVKDGGIIGTVYQDADFEGGEAARKLLQLIGGEEPDEMQTFIEMTLVDQSNVDELLK